MQFITPKTNWQGTTDEDGIYTGDYFNAHDFNRIKNNLVYLCEYARTMFEDFEIQDTGADRIPADYLYADEINALEKNLDTINQNTYKRDYGEGMKYYTNGLTMDFTELNRIESATLDLHHRLTTQQENKRMFIFNFGIRGGIY